MAQLYINLCTSRRAIDREGLLRCRLVVLQLGERPGLYNRRFCIIRICDEGGFAEAIELYLVVGYHTNPTRSPTYS